MVSKAGKSRCRRQSNDAHVCVEAESARVKKGREMILGTDKLYTVGSVVYVYVTDLYGLYSPEKQPIYIIRQATREEWEAGIRADGGTPRGPATFFYECSTD
jgi:hypothetical protein